MKLFQLKASCLSAFVLNPSPESLIIDGCAAPGNKTTHLACMVHNEGYASRDFQKNYLYLETLWTDNSFGKKKLFLNENIDLNNFENKFFYFKFRFS